MHRRWQLQEAEKRGSGDARLKFDRNPVTPFPNVEKGSMTTNRYFCKVLLGVAHHLDLERELGSLFAFGGLAEVVVWPDQSGLPPMVHQLQAYKAPSTHPFARNRTIR